MWRGSCSRKQRPICNTREFLDSVHVSKITLKRVGSDSIVISAIKSNTSSNRPLCLSAMNQIIDWWVEQKWLKICLPWIIALTDESYVIFFRTAWNTLLALSISWQRAERSKKVSDESYRINHDKTKSHTIYLN